MTGKTRALGQLAAPALALTLVACSTRPGYTSALLSSDAPEVDDPAYRDDLERFTRWQTEYDGLDARVFLAATWQSWPMRRSRVAAVARFQDLPASRAASMLAQEMADARSYTDVFLGLYTAEYRWNDLSSPRSIWHVQLESVPGGAVEPIAIERIERPDANLRALYPYLSPFWVGYRLRFPGPPPGPVPGTLVLRLASAAANVEVSWETQGVEPPPPEEAPSPAAEPGPAP